MVRTEIESRRFRTWESDTTSAGPAAWRTIFKYGLVRTLRTWYISLILVMALILMILFLGVGFVSSASSGFTGNDVLGTIGVFLVPAALVVLFVGSPILAEDLRFNAPLFYFSKPLGVRDYYIGKVALLGGMLAAVWLLPIMIALLLLPLAGLPDVPETFGFGGGEVNPEYRHDWRVSHIDTVADILYVFAVLIPGAAVVLLFATTFTIMVSSLARKAWHAAMGILAPLVAISLLGAVGAGAVRNAMWVTLGPLQWIMGVLFMPLELRFSHSANPFEGAASKEFELAGPAIALCYLFLILASAASVYVTHLRLRRVEALL